MSPVLNTIPNGTNDCGTVIMTSQNALMRPQQLACEKGSAERLAPTAALVSVQGRVKTSSGTGIRNAIVEVNGGTLTENPIRGRKNSFG